MRDYTHAIAIRFVDKMNEYRGYTESERIVITYGLELFLNNNLKLMIYLIIGSVCNIFTETVIAVLVMAVLRILTGGYHSQSDLDRRWGIIVILVSLMQGLSLIKMKRRIM